MSELRGDVPFPTWPFTTFPLMLPPKRFVNDDWVTEDVCGACGTSFPLSADCWIRSSPLLNVIMSLMKHATADAADPFSFEVS